jgi:hypothetical protein
VTWYPTPQDVVGNTISTAKDMSMPMCRQSCQKNSACKGIVVDFQAGKGKTGNCMLKSDVSKPVASTDKYLFMINRAPK